MFDEENYRLILRKKTERVTILLLLCKSAVHAQLHIPFSLESELEGDV